MDLLKILSHCANFSLRQRPDIPYTSYGRKKSIEAIRDREMIALEVCKEVIKYTKGDLSRNVGWFNLKD